MQQKLIKKLNQINKEFYQQTHIYFNASRSYAWEGWNVLWEYLQNKDISPKSILDVGCGNARFLQFIEQKTSEFSYFGIDSNNELLTIGKKIGSPNAKFKLQDILVNSDFDKLQRHFDLIVLFGVMHHVPGYSSRLSLLQNLKQLLTASGRICFTGWNFMQEQHYRNKILPWNSLEIDETDLEANDFLLSWKRGVSALRYCHYLDHLEAEQLAQQAGLVIEGSFKADGKSGELNTYYVLKLATATN